MSKNIIFPTFNHQGCALRRICSFVRRDGRVTKKQRQALDTLWAVMGVDYQVKFLDFNILFSRTARVTLEIGFGMGESLVVMAQAESEQDFLGVEVYLAGIGACLASAREVNLSNIRVICHDAVEVLEHMIPDNSLARVQLFFPDPWQKARHNKRRIVQVPFVKLVAQKLSKHGVFHMATDWQPYAEHMVMVMSKTDSFRNLSSSGDYILRPGSRPLTKFERRGQRLGHTIWDLIFEKKS
ncbi:tRNA (guanosine(46)-N7)-methyltransferase TrmB [Candidatus Steffania adelgidicola]|uniref:tRNA (guanosine(46)-N7)-methyltransferase TrmB n=1 Tax=Candidatus Steffania adelgidicola TaxID=1076626 RepID=UPI001D01EC49|nr:tRNA (guanosine(46)-N7)-methyltransferase TrmB [Candidatus Steffania adelgidicola]UDG79596.1 tRNA (guanine-N(7)-)-methyltransferase [Candidatus Steffania adelgidicola]